MADTIGQADIRGENISRALKGFALQKFRMKEVFLQINSSAWTETYYRETATELTPGGETFAIQGVGRGSAFPFVEPSWTKVQGRHIKYAAEGIVWLEDKLTNAFDTQARTFLRVARAIAKQFDDNAYDTLSAATGINTVAAAATWDSATVADRDPIGDILNAISQLDIDDYDALENGFLLVSPTDYKNLMRNSKVINNPSFKTADVVSNGKVGQICGLTIIKTNAVNADEAMVLVGKQAATLRTAVDLSAVAIEDPGIKFTIRGWMINQIQVTDPEAICTITDTQA
tara:strand:- start:40 stop:900 length:861 start_codon:yes stop_codon:yes gene_type:complete